jgi:hypothetical protein
VAGAVVAKLNTAALAKLKALPSKGTGGKARIYALKEALGTLVAPGARVVAVHLGDGSTVSVDAKAWTDATRSPVVWQNRRGLFKLGWLDDKGQAMPTNMELRDVRALDVIKP